MSKTWLVSDTHFMHNNMYKFTMPDGSKVRPWDTAEEGDAIMIERWNSVVNDRDRVFHLGDVAIPRRGLKILEQLKGRKALVRGNHDPFKLRDLSQYFDDVYGSLKKGNLILSHIPIHPGSLPKWCKCNVHGHLHKTLVMKTVRGSWVNLWKKESVPDPRYINVCVEHTNYTPINLDEVIAISESRTY